MKRLNEKTNSPFVTGDIREDGMIFKTYLRKVKKDGYFKEVWFSKETFLKQDALQKSLGRAWRKKRSEYRGKFIKRVKMMKGCSVCGYRENAVALDFDHIDRHSKSFNIGEKKDSVSMISLKDEIRKCRVICANCHRIHSHSEQHHLNNFNIGELMTPKKERLSMAFDVGNKPHRVKSNNNSGMTGVNYHKSSGLWEARILINGKRYYLGRVKDRFEAFCLRKSAENKYRMIAELEDDTTA